MKFSLFLTLPLLLLLFQIVNAQKPSPCDVCISACKSNPNGLDPNCLNICNTNLACSFTITSIKTSSTKTNTLLLRAATLQKIAPTTTSSLNNSTISTTNSATATATATLVLKSGASQHQNIITCIKKIIFSFLLY